MQQSERTFEQTINVVYNHVVQYLDFKDIISLIAALNIKNIKFNYDTIVINSQYQEKYLKNNKKHFNYSGIVMSNFRLKSHNLNFNKTVKYIKLKSNYFEKFPQFNKLPNLQRLELTCSHFTTIPKKLPPNIQYLDLSFNILSEIKNLDNLSKLVKLDLTYNIDLAEINNLDNLTNLAEINLSDNCIRSIKGLDNLINLRKLILSNNKITKLQCLDKLINLKELILIGNRITKIENLKLPELNYLDLSVNKIETIQNLHECPKLKKLRMCYNNIETIENLQYNTLIEHLDLFMNEINNINGIFCLKNLNILVMDYNPITNEDVEKIREHFVNLDSRYIPIPRNWDPINN
ncbi:Leucine-rich repeat,Leucine-rich repeat domain, L domain-like,Leucine-rich repeat, typical subtype,Leucine [Cinara cedri]|uniref:Dynein axonemal assembly factor 1 homolog n=1 Tax=Cinara cedri TaxID=506608 RepID=A0A5E4M9R9_9HEMI|nr:Leucine-rich repeat,Leucine-rich repeat domain, L domain-like,Leucine-rich repeat, typical subtype,Leucine [Cinara cedri]